MQSGMSESEQAAAALDRDEILRYGRHLTLPEVGVEGQLRLRRGSVLVVGAGGLGSPAALYLAAAGVGRLGLVDFDRVELSNLQRQVLYGSRDVGEPKLARAVARLGDLNPRVRIEPHAVRFDATNARALVARYDVVLDGSDNFETRYLVNDACVLEGRPVVYGSIFRFEGQLSVFWPGRGPCYRCLYPAPPPPGAVPSCAEGGVLGVLPGIVGSLQAAEAIKLLLGRGNPLVGRLLVVDALAMRFRELALRRDADCPVCGERPTITELRPEADDACPAPAAVEQVGVEALAARLGGDDPPFLLDVRTPEEWAIARIEGAHLLPLQELAARAEELDRDREIVVHCHHGGRSAMAARWLAAHGFGRVGNLSGGIDAWSARIDPSVPRY